jgi:hypothetical protein
MQRTSGKIAKKAKLPLLFTQRFLQNAFRHHPLDYHDLFCISNDQDYRNYCDYRLGEKTLNNHMQEEAIIVFCEKLKMAFRTNPLVSGHLSDFLRNRFLGLIL